MESPLRAKAAPQLFRAYVQQALAVDRRAFRLRHLSDVSYVAAPSEGASRPSFRGLELPCWIEA